MKTINKVSPAIALKYNNKDIPDITNNKLEKFLEETLLVSK